MKAMKLKPNVKFEKKTGKYPLISIVYYLQGACLQKNSHGRLLSMRVFSSDGHYGLIVIVSPRMNTIASFDQFKPMRIGEKLVVNYN